MNEILGCELKKKKENKIKIKIECLFFRGYVKTMNTF